MSLFKNLAKSALNTNNADLRAEIAPIYADYEADAPPAPEGEKTAREGGVLKGKAFIAVNPEPPHEMSAEMQILREEFERVNRMMHEAERALYHAQQDALAYQDDLGETTPYLKTQWSSVRQPKDGYPIMPDVIVDSPKRMGADGEVVNLGDITYAYRQNDLMFPAYVVSGLWGFDVNRKPYPIVRFPSMPNNGEAESWLVGAGIKRPVQNDPTAPMTTTLLLPYGISAVDTDAWKVAGKPSASDPFILRARQIDPAFSGDNIAARRLIQGFALKEYVDELNAPAQAARENLRWLREYVGSLPFAKWPRRQNEDNGGDKPATPAKPAPATPDDY